MQFPGCGFIGIKSFGESLIQTLAHGFNVMEIWKLNPFMQWILGYNIFNSLVSIFNI